MNLRQNSAWILAALLMAPGTWANAQSSECNVPLASASQTVQLPSNPFGVKISADGCWVFVSVGGPNGGVAVLKRAGEKVEMVRVVRVTPAPAGIALTHDGTLLAAAANNSAVILDVQKMTSGASDPIVGTFDAKAGPFRGSVYVNFAADDKLLFVSQESAQTITVIDFERARGNGYKSDAILGNIPVGVAPIALTFSLDDKFLYTTSQVAPQEWNWPAACKPEGLSQAPAQIAARRANAKSLLAALQAQQASVSDAGAAQLQQQIDLQRQIVESPTAVPVSNPEGAIVVIEMARVRTSPANSVVARVPAGCSAVRMSMSPDGRRVYVTARNSNSVGVFDTAKLVLDPEHARLGASPVGEAPVPVMVVDGGKKVVAGNSNRFGAPSGGETLSVLDAAKMERAGMDASLGTIPSGVFPREMAISADGHTLFLANAGSSSLQVMEIARLPIEPPKTK